jgi:ribonuclease-3
MDDEANMVELEEAIGYSFTKRDLLVRALSHRSFTNEVDGATADNQRLEFLGDAVLGLVTARKLFDQFPEVQEGPLSATQSGLVNEDALAEVARRIDLGRFVRLGRGEDLSGGRAKPSLLSDAYEAVLAAVYLDGGLGAAELVISRLQGNDILTCKPARSAPEDYKSKLQKQVQREKTTRPVYTIVSETGPAHDRRFEAEVSVEGDALTRGIGRSKKEAEQRAAESALALLEHSGD